MSNADFAKQFGFRSEAYTAIPSQNLTAISRRSRVAQRVTRSHFQDEVVDADKRNAIANRDGRQETEEVSMTDAATGEERQGALRWIEDGESVLRVLHGMLNDYDRVRERAEAAERENEQLRNRLETSERQCEQLGEAVNHHQREREEIAELLAEFMNAVLTRLRRRQAGSRFCRRDPVSRVYRNTTSAEGGSDARA